MRKLLLAMLIVCISATFAYAVAHSIVWGTSVGGGETVSITPSGDVDFDMGTYFSNNREILFIQFKPSAVNDVICILDGSNLGPPLLYATSVDGGNLIVYPGVRCRPYMVYASCTFGTAANARITIGYK